MAGIFVFPPAAIESIDYCFDMEDACNNVGVLRFEIPQTKTSPLKVSKELNSPNASFLIDFARSRGNGMLVISLSVIFSVGGGGGISRPN